MEVKPCHRSNYGVKTYTPEESKNQWKECVEKHRIIQQNHKCSTEEREKKKQIKMGNLVTNSYFDNSKQHTPVSAYERQFRIEHGYRSELKRDDRQHIVGLNVNLEERNKRVPILSSSTYGHRAHLENHVRKHCRVSLVKRDFFRECGTNIPLSSQEL